MLSGGGALRGLGGTWAVCDRDGRVLLSGGEAFAEGALAVRDDEPDLAWGDLLRAPAVTASGCVMRTFELSAGRVLVTCADLMPAAAMSRLCLMGGFAVRGPDGETRVAGGDRRRAHDLLLVLCAMRRSPMRRSEAARLLWPQASREAAGDALRALLRDSGRLQVDLGAPDGVEVLVQRPLTLSVRRDLVSCDLHEIFDACRGVRTLTALGLMREAGRFAVAATRRVVECGAGGVPAVECERFAGLEQIAERAEADLAVLLTVAAERLRAAGDEREAAFLLREGVRCTPRTTVLAWAAVHDAARRGAMDEARDVYERHYAGKVREPVGFEEMCARSQRTMRALAPLWE